jgi:hypothetical protein
MNGPWPEEMVDKFVGHRLVVVAGGRCVWNDLALLNIRGENSEGWHIMCINDIVMHYPGKVDHHYSNDHRMMPPWISARRPNHVRRFGNPKYTHSCRVGGKYSWPLPGHGTSTLNGVYAGLAMGYDPIVICGAPLDDTGHYFDPPWVVSNFCREVGEKESGEMMYWAGAKKRVFGGKVYSMSGRTKELLGGYP